MQATVKIADLSEHFSKYLRFLSGTAGLCKEGTSGAKALAQPTGGMLSAMNFRGAPGLPFGRQQQQL